jgi:guanyl-specific ribonuclease Sa
MGDPQASNQQQPNQPQPTTPPAPATQPSQPSGQQSAQQYQKNRGALPPDAKKALDDIEKGTPRPNVRKPKPFENDGRGGTQQLPQKDANGNPVTYTEYTVNPRPPGGNLDGQRFFLGSDGSEWYTGDHMVTIERVN